ncbi:Gfo/Idh/MocA family oxidoreductase [soil metagenome]
MGRGWAKNLASNPDVTLASWVDVREGAAAQAATELDLKVDHTGTDVEKAIREVQPDFIVDVTPPEVHHSVTTLALGLGVPVLGEKPMAWTMQQAKEMVAASEASGKLYMVSQSRRYNGAVYAYRDLIQAQIGNLGILNADFYIGAHFGGFRDEMESPLVLDMAIHTFDMARMFSGKDCVSVYAEEFNPIWSWYKGNSSAVCLFEMEGGVRFDYRGSWAAEGCGTSWESDWRAIGSKGTALWDGDQKIDGEVVASEEGFIRATTPISATPQPAVGGIEGSLAEFLLALKTGTKPKNGECHDNFKSFAMVMAAHESAKQGRRINLEEFIASAH